MLVKLAKVRIERNDITPAEVDILKYVVRHDECISADVATELNKSVQYVGKVLNKLFDAKLVHTRKHGKTKYYTPSLDAVIAYSESEE